MKLRNSSRKRWICLLVACGLLAMVAGLSVSSDIVTTISSDKTAVSRGDVVTFTAKLVNTSALQIAAPLFRIPPNAALSLLEESVTVDGVRVTPTIDGSGNAIVVVPGLAPSQTRTIQWQAVAVGPGTPVRIYFEAESGQLSEPMSAIADANVSGGKYIASGTANSGSASYTFTVPVSGEYVIWCRVLAPKDGQDSFTVAIDDGQEDIFDCAEGTWSTSWQWSRVNGRAGGSPLTLNPRVFNLTEGEHKLVIRAWDANTGLDRIIITNDRNFVPQDTPTGTPDASDTTPPTITDVTVTNLKADSATITWTTNEPATSQVEWGTSMEFGNTTPEDSSLTTNHSVNLTGLMPGTQYYFRVRSKDAARNEAVSDGSSFKTYLQLKPGPYKVEDLGVLVQSASIDALFMFRHPGDNHLHLMLGYAFVFPLQYVDIDLDTGEVFSFDARGSRCGAKGLVPHPNGWIYITTGDTGYFYAYNPTNKVVREIGRFGDRDGYIAVLGDDNSVYIGGSTKGCVDRYNPETDVLETFGIMDDPGPPYYRYVYTLGADGRYVYAAIGQNPWYLVVYDCQTKEQRVYWKTANAGYVGVSRGWKDGVPGWYAEVSGGSAAGFYKLENGQPIATSRTGVTLSPWYQRGMPYVSSELSTFPSLFGFEVNLDKAIPYSSSSNGEITVRWRPVGQNQWKEARTAVRCAPQPLKRLYQYGNELFGFVEAYGPTFTYNPATRAVNLLGRTGYSCYDAVHTQGIWFLSGYPAATLRYDPAIPWTLTPSTTDQSTTNPRKLTGIHKYHYYSAVGADGNVYVGVHHERDSTGGELGWYDRNTGDLKGRLRDPFVKFDVRDLKAALGGQKIVYSSINIDGIPPAKLFVFDTTKKIIEREIAPLTDVSALDKILETSPGVIFGICGNRYYKVDIRTGQVLYIKDLGGDAFTGMRSYDRRLTLGPDGYVWLYIGNSICRVEPDSGTVEKIVDASPAGGLTFLNGDLYIWGYPNLRRVTGLFPSE